MTTIDRSSDEIVFIQFNVFILYHSTHYSNIIVNISYIWYCTLYFVNYQELVLVLALIRQIQPRVLVLLHPAVAHPHIVNVFMSGGTQDSPVTLMFCCNAHLGLSQLPLGWSEQVLTGLSSPLDGLHGANIHNNFLMTGNLIQNKEWLRQQHVR